MAEKRVTESTETESIAEQITQARLSRGNDGGKREINLVKYTEAIDKLVLQNKQLQRDLTEADNELDSLTERLKDSSIRISKNLFYISIAVILYVAYLLIGQITAFNLALVETRVVLKEYKLEIEKNKMYNDILEKKIDINK